VPLSEPVRCRERTLLCAVHLQSEGFDVGTVLYQSTQLTHTVDVRIGIEIGSFSFTIMTSIHTAPMCVLYALHAIYTYVRCHREEWYPTRLIHLDPFRLISSTPLYCAPIVFTHVALSVLFPSHIPDLRHISVRIIFRQKSGPNGYLFYRFRAM
jgi:hypothetical protein